MIRWLPALCMLILLSSCATILNRRSTKIEIHTIPDSVKVVLDSGLTVTSPVILQVPRSYDDFKLTFLKDTVSKTVLVRSKIAPQVWGNLVLLIYSPVGLFIDLYSKKKIFSYRKDLLADLTVEPPKIRKWYPNQKGNVYLEVKMPALNFLKLDTGLKAGNYTMLFGMILGADYYYSRQGFISAELGSTGAFHPGNRFLGRQVADSSGKVIPDTVEKATSVFLRINNNHDFKVASIGYGLNLSDYLYSKTITDSSGQKTSTGKTLHSLSLGCNAGVSVRVFQFLTVGITYAPSFFNLSAGRYEYSHVIYLDAGIRLHLGKHGKTPLKLIKYQPHYTDRNNR